MNTTQLRLAIACAAPLLAVGTAQTAKEIAAAFQTETQDSIKTTALEQTVKVEYLEIVTPEVDTTCLTLEKAHGVRFGEPVPEFGGARTADLSDGGRIGVRGPLRETETPVVRPYLLVTDINAAVEAAKEAGAEIAIPPMEIPGQGMFSIYILGGIEHGLWQK